MRELLDTILVCNALLLHQNGMGKTTLMEIIAGQDTEYEGRIKIHGSFAYVPQLRNEDMADYLSGGEKTWEKLSRAFGEKVHFMLLDEPTSNLSISHIEQLQDQLYYFNGSIVLISHDRDLLNGVCDKILEIENGKIKEYTGNYDAYQVEKEREQDLQWLKYEQYAAKKKQLTNRSREIKQKAPGMLKAPKRMGLSEARLGKDKFTSKRAKVERRAKAIDNRLESMEKVEKPRELPQTKMVFIPGDRLHAGISVEGKEITKAFGKKIIFDNADFKIETGNKIGLLGENGAGKTTFLNMIINKESGIRWAVKLKPAYYHQDLVFPDENRTIYDYMQDGSRLSQSEIRTILSLFLFFKDDVFKKIHMLSGGEKVKVSLAKMFISEANMLILDEPTNFLDMASLDALAQLIRDYYSTVLVVSHDRHFLQQAVDRFLVIQNKRVETFYPDNPEKP